MPIAVTTTKTSLAASYAALGVYVGLATGAPGSTSTPSSEVTGGSPAYARVACTWSAGSAGVQNGTAVTINVPTTTVVTYMLVASASTGATMFDNCSVTSTTFTGQGTAVVTPTYTQT
jgi:propanediol dehydratase large subunit